MNEPHTELASLKSEAALLDQMFYKSRIDDQARERLEAIDREKRVGEKVAQSAIYNIERGEQLDNELFLSQLLLSQTSLASFLHVIQTELESYIGEKNVIR